MFQTEKEMQESLAKYYTNLGYEVYTEVQLGRRHVDLIAINRKFEQKNNFGIFLNKLKKNKI